MMEHFGGVMVESTVALLGPVPCKKPHFFFFFLSERHSFRRGISNYSDCNWETQIRCRDQRRGDWNSSGVSKQTTAYILSFLPPLHLILVSHIRSLKNRDLGH